MRPLAAAIVIAHTVVACGGIAVIDPDDPGDGGAAGTGGTGGTATGTGGTATGTGTTPTGTGGSGTNVPTGTVEDWPESIGFLYAEGGEVYYSEDYPAPDGLVTWWSVGNIDSSGYWYGDNDDTFVARAIGVTQVSQITDAFSLDYDSWSTSVVEEGQFAVAWHVPTDQFIAVRFDDIYPNPIDEFPYAYANVTWWYDDDGDFRSF